MRRDWVKGTKAAQAARLTRVVSVITNQVSLNSVERSHLAFLARQKPDEHDSERAADGLPAR